MQLFTQSVYFPYGGKLNPNSLIWCRTCPRAIARFHLKSSCSSSVLGMFKREAVIHKGIFLAPKAYYLENEKNEVLKFKGQAKNLVDPEWFKSQLEAPSREEQVPVVSNFRIDWPNLTVRKMETVVKLGLKLGVKRTPVYHGGGY